MFYFFYNGISANLRVKHIFNVNFELFYTVHFYLYSVIELNTFKLILGNGNKPKLSN